MNDEARAHIKLIVEKFPPIVPYSLEAMRIRGENVHRTINEQLIGTFKGTEQEKTVKVDDGTGIIENRKDFTRNDRMII